MARVAAFRRQLGPKPPMRKLRWLVPLLLIVASPLVADDEKDSRDLTDALNLAGVWLDAEQDFNDLPGVAAAIVRDQEIVWSGAFGHADLEAGVPLKPETRFHIASISKTFAAVATMTLVDAGKIRLDDRVEDVVPWFHPPQPEHDNAPVTIRTLLTHSSGLTREIPSPIWADLRQTPVGPEMRTEFSVEPLLYPTSTYFQYSNLAYLTLGEIVAHVSGMPYVDYLREHVLDPLGLDATVASYPESEYGASHAVRYGAPLRDRSYPRLGYTTSGDIAAMGGLSSNVLDLADYARWQLRLHEEDATAEVLRPSTLRAMHRVQFTDPNWKSTWGLGFSVRKGPKDVTLVGHGGHLPGHTSSLLMDPKGKMAYVVMVNTSGASPGTYAERLMGLVGKLEGVPDGDDDEAKKRLERSRLEEFEGEYTFPEGMGTVYVAPWEGRLAVLDLPSDDPATDMSVYEHVEGDRFRRVRDDGAYGEALIFTRDAAGRVIAGRYYSYEFRRVFD